MPVQADTSCFYTIVKNLSGVRRTFGFLPPHGRTLDPDQELAIFGNLLQSVGSIAGAEHSVRRRAQAALEASIENGDLEIVSTPSMILRDTQTGAVKTVKLTNGALVVDDPCWHDSVSES